MLPIKDPNVLAKVQQCLLEDFKAGRRNYTIFQVGKATLLRVSDVLTLQWTDVFDEKAMCVRIGFSMTAKRPKSVISLT